MESAAAVHPYRAPAVGVSATDSGSDLNHVTPRVRQGDTMKTRVVVLGAGFGGLELTTILSDAVGDEIDIVLIDKGAAFVFGFSKLDVMFGRQLPAAVRHRYRDIVKPG